MENKKGATIMHESEMLAGWFLMIIAGMIVTMLMSWMIFESRRSEVNQGECERFPPHQGLDERVGSIAPIAIEA
jgi:hypothetical protein